MSVEVVFPRVQDLEWVFEPSWSRAVVCSPWLPTAGVEAIRRCLVVPSAKGSGRSMELWFRVSPEDVVQGQWTDIVAVQHFVEELSSKEAGLKVALRTTERLHAKIYATNLRALVTFANLSAAGFGIGEIQNVEIALRLSRKEDLACLWDYLEKAGNRTEGLPQAALASIAEALKKGRVVRSVQTICKNLHTLKEAIRTERWEPPTYICPCGEKGWRSEIDYLFPPRRTDRADPDGSHLPSQDESLFPALLDVHGGAWNDQDRTTNAPVDEQLPVL